MIIDQPQRVNAPPFVIYTLPSFSARFGPSNPLTPEGPLRIDLFQMERTQCLYENEVEFNLSESGVLPLRVEEIWRVRKIGRHFFLSV